MEKRKQKSAIINLSSFMGDMAYPFITLYAATKAFNK
jgi:short-subunit dehydrogenase